jgi:hypothetical protein
MYFDIPTNGPNAHPARGKAGTPENSVVCPDNQPASCLMRSARRPNTSFTYPNALGSASSGSSSCERQMPDRLGRRPHLDFDVVA